MTHNKPAPMRHRSHSTGFTLVEMAVVVTLIGILLTMGLVTATSMMQNTQRSVTKERLSAIRLALMAYYRANTGVFPCPDAPGAAPAVRDGLQNVAGAACSAQFGTVPYTDLGLPRETALDGYGNYISYRLATNWHTAGLATTPLCASSSTERYFRPPVPAPAITVNYSSGPAATVGIVLISHGSNGFGAWNQGNTTATKNATAGATAAEITNQTSGATYNDLQTPVAPNTTFDDLVATLAPANIMCN